MVADASPPSDDRAALAAALGAYELGPELGRGTWGVVIRARHRALDRPVAIKVLPTAFGSDPSVRERFVAEARVVAGMDHPHIVAVHDFVDDGSTCAIVMELLAGGTVWERATSDGLTAEVACAIVLGLCAGLHHAHGLGVTHRDVKPENLLLAASGAPKLGDFGIARLVGASAAARTATGIVLGTPAYLAPEQATGGPVGPATDVHGAGVVLYELLSGQLPYGEAESPVTQIRRVAYEEPTQLAVVAPWVPSSVVAVTMRALNKDPAGRPPSAEALGVELARAASAAFGRGWLAATQVPVLDAPAILAAAGEGPDRSARETGIVVRPQVGDTRGACEVPHDDLVLDGAALLLAETPDTFDLDTATLRATASWDRPDRIVVGSPDDVERAQRLAATAPPVGLPALPVTPPTLDGLPPLPYGAVPAEPAATTGPDGDPDA